jgi:uncharacterized membrane protein
MPKKKNEVQNLLLHAFELKDILQVIIGATILAIPVGFTEEAWRLGENLPWLNIIGLFLLSMNSMAANLSKGWYQHMHFLL